MAINGLNMQLLAWSLNWLVTPHWENYISISIHIEWDMIVGTVFLSVLNQMDFHLIQNWKENCPHDHIPFSLKGNRVFSLVAAAKNRPDEFN